jgi:indolepyruvate ferredoxin oxidoreductase alpha subunit
MTGGQQTAATGDELIRVIRGLGVRSEHLVLLDPLPKNHERNVAAIRREIVHQGCSVIVARRACIHAKRRSSSGSSEPRRETDAVAAVEGK